MTPELTKKFADPYVYQGTSVLVNKAGIRDEAAFKTLEYEQTALRSAELRDFPLPTTFKFRNVLAIHSHLFQDVYDWAGQPRTIDLSKGGTTFERPQNFAAAAKRFDEKMTALGSFDGLKREEFVQKLALVFANLNEMHVFREGNGRTAREFMAQVVAKAGYELDQRLIEADKAQWNDASKLALQGKMGPLNDFLTKAVRPKNSVAFETLPRAIAIKRFPDLEPAYEAMDSLKLSLMDKYPGNSKAQEHFFSQAQSETIRKLNRGAQIYLGSQAESGVNKSHPGTVPSRTMDPMRPPSIGGSVFGSLAPTREATTAPVVAPSRSPMDTRRQEASPFRPRP